jgi:aminoglycoside 3-N-acetyltransferase
VVVPTSSFRFCSAPKPPGTPTRPFNSEGEPSIPVEAPGFGFAPAATFVDPAMGALPATVLQQPGRQRGDHPLNSFTALGADAAGSVSGQTPFDVYAPLQHLVDTGGAIALLGVDLTAATLLHLAEFQAGLRLLHRWGRYADGRILEVRHGGCSRGFERLAGAVSGAERRVLVGQSLWRVYDAGALLDLATRAFGDDPGAGRCADEQCVRCRDQVAYGLASKPRAS